MGIPNPSAQEIIRGAGSTELSGLEWLVGRLGVSQLCPGSTCCIDKEFCQQRYFSIPQNPVPSLITTAESGLWIWGRV